MSPSALATRRPASGSSPLGRPGGQLHAELRRRRSRRTRWVAAAVAALLLVLAGLAAWLVGMSSVFAAREVIVQGQRELAADQVREVAAVPLGVPLLRQDLDAVARRTAALPQVASATVSRDWPNTVVVSVTEREPVLAVLQPTGFALVDANGVAYATRADVPEGVLRADADPTSPALLTELAGVAAAFPEDLRGKVERIRATSPSNITLLLQGGVTVRWGDATESPLKAQIVSSLLTKKTQSIDVSAPHNPATR